MRLILVRSGETVYVIILRFGFQCKNDILSVPTSSLTLHKPKKKNKDIIHCEKLRPPALVPAPADQACVGAIFSKQGAAGLLRNTLLTYLRTGFLFLGEWRSLITTL